MKKAMKEKTKLETTLGLVDKTIRSLYLARRSVLSLTRLGQLEANCPARKNIDHAIDYLEVWEKTLEAELEPGGKAPRAGTTFFKGSKPVLFVAARSKKP